MNVPSTPSRIEYIVLSHLEEAQNLIEDFGYQAPIHPREVIDGIKFLIRKYRQKAIKALLKIHPDRKAIMSIEKEMEDHFCSACSEYTYDPTHDHCGSCGHSNYNSNAMEELSNLKELGIEALDKRYHELLEKSKNSPDDTVLQKQVQQYWNELRTRKSEGESPTENEDHIEVVSMTKNGLFTVMALTLIVGGIIGFGLKKGKA